MRISDYSHPTYKLKASTQPNIVLNNIKVFCEDNHHGGGIRWAPEFSKIFSNSPDLKNKSFAALELCCGPGFIGFNLLGAGTVRKLALGYINPAVEEKYKKLSKKIKFLN